MWYIIVTLALVIVVPVSYKLGQRHGARLERAARWSGVQELDDLSPREALAMMEGATRVWDSHPWHIKVTDAITGTEFTIKNKSLPDLVATKVRYEAAQRTIKQLEA